MCIRDSPGNVRELENMLERAMTMAEGDVIEAADLRLPQVSPPTQAASAVKPPPDAIPQPTVQPAPSAAPPAPSAPLDMVDVGNGQALPDAIEQMERAAIEQALIANRYNKTKTAAQLGITFRALRYKLKKLGID